MKIDSVVKYVVIAHMFRKPIYFHHIDMILRELIDTDKLEQYVCPFCNRKFSSAYALSSHLFNTVRPSKCSRAMNIVIRYTAQLYREWRYSAPKYQLNHYPKKSLMQFLKEKNVKGYRERSR